MKSSMIGMALAFAVLINCENSNAEIANQTKQFSPGGVSIDFSGKKVQSEDTGGNLIADGKFENTDAALTIYDSPGKWRKAFYAHARTDQKELATLARKMIPQLLTQEIVAGNAAEGNKCVKLGTPAETLKYRPEGKLMISNQIKQPIVMPPMSSPEKLKLTFKCNGKIENIPGLNSFIVLVYFSDKDKKETRKYVNQQIALSENWQERSVEFIVPSNTCTVAISLALYGCGNVFLDDIKLSKTKVEHGVTGKLMPGAFMDNKFCISQDEPAIMVFGFRNESKAPVNNPFLLVKLPTGFKVIDQRNILPLTENTSPDGYTTYKIDLDKIKSFFGQDIYQMYHLASLLVTTSLPAGNKNYNAEYWYEDGTYRSPVDKFELQVIPAIGIIQSPKIFKTGIQLRREGDFVGKGAETFAKFYKNSGFNCIQGNGTTELNSALKNNNIFRFQELYFLANGYRIGGNDKPDNVKFQLADGSYLTSPHQIICPTEVYRQGSYYRNQVVGMLKDALENNSADSIMCNWEPYMFDFKGCFCPRCKEEFIKYSGLPADEVNNVWPKEVIVKYKDQWIKFRSWQHGQICSTLDKTISQLGQKAGKPDAHFVPEIAWSQLIEKTNPDFAQYNPLDYMQDLPWIEPWGPYIFYDFTKPYIYNTGAHLITWTAAKDNKEFVNKHISDKTRRPKMIAFPHGYQLDSWVTEPEAIAFENICFFLNGWEGSIVYLFPKGFDNRYWAALAEANSQIAEYENFVFKGRKQDKHSLEFITPLPKTNLPVFWNEGGNFLQKLPSLANANIIQSIEYQLDDKRLIAIGNFWQKGETFVKLKITGLDANGKYVLCQPDKKRCSAGKNRQVALTANELAEGLTVHIGALRWEFFVVEPYRQGINYGDVITAQDMNSLLKSRLPEIEKAMSWEQKYLASKQAQTDKENALPDYSNIKELTNNKISCRKLDAEGRICLVFESEKNILKIDLTTGGRLMSWVNNGTELVSQDNKTGLGVDAFWWPAKIACMISGSYKVLSQTKTQNGLNVVLEREITVKDNIELAGAVIRKTWEIATDSVILTSELINKTEKELNFSFRWHNMPAFLEFHDGKSGMALLKNGENDEPFKRIFASKLYRYAANPNKDLEKLFPLEQSAVITSPEVIFSCPWSKEKLTANILSAKELHCFVFWDSGKQKTSTFEPVFNKVVLAPGKKWSATVKWSVN